MSKRWAYAKDAFWLIVAIAIVGGGFAGFRIMGELKTPVAAKAVERVVPIVDVQDLERFDGPLPIRGEGFVAAYREVPLAFEVPGRIVTLHPAIDERGSFAKGDVLARLDDRAARSALSRAQSDLDTTRARLDLNETQLARSQTLLERGVISQDRVDQLLSENAELKASIASLGSAVESAELALDDTVVTALFDGAVLEQNAELGAVVSAGQQIAHLFTNRELEVTVAVAEAKAALVPGLFDGSRASGEVTARFAGRDFSWDAVVSRVDPALDRRTRTVGVTLTLNDPIPDRSSGPAADLPAGAPPALLNAFVKVTIDGIAGEGLYTVPSTVVRSGSVWLTADDKLVIEPVEVVHVDGERTFVRFESDPADMQLVTSLLDAPAAGMAVRTVASPDQSAALGD